MAITEVELADKIEVYNQGMLTSIEKKILQTSQWFMLMKFSLHSQQNNADVLWMTLHVMTQGYFLTQGHRDAW